MILHVIGWCVLVVVACAVAGFIAANFTDKDPGWTRDKRVGAGVFLTGLFILLALLVVKSYPF